MSNGLYPRRPHSRPSVRAWSLLAALLLGPLAPPVAVAQTQPVVLPKVPYVEAALVNGRVRVAYDTQGTSISVAPSMVRDLRASYDAAVVSVTDADLQMALPPISEAGDPQTVVEGTTVTLNGNRSVGIGPPSEPLIYVWTQTGGAPRVDLENADTAHPTFTAPDGLAPDTMLELTFKLRIITEIVAAFDTVVITVVNAVAVAAPGDQTYTLDTVIKDLTLPEATGGIGTATYTLMPLPDGLTFDVDSRVLSGTPTTEETVTAIYTATDERGASQLDTFIITISPDMLLEFATTRFALPEHSDPPQVMLSATNANGNAVTLALLDGLDADLFTLEDSLSIGGTTTANLRFKVSPDFENPRDVDISGGFDAAGNNSYRVQVRASSMSLRGDMLQITENITVIVTNIDEYDPVLNTTQTTYNVPENSTGAFVTLQASDAGGDTLRFVIVDDTATSPDRASFTLNPSTGALAFASPPDFEAPDDVGNDRTYQITVQATSTSTSGSGSGSGSSTPPRASNPLTLTINVTPVDEYDPIITPDQSIYAFPEGATGPIATFTIVDDDAGEVREFRPLGAAPGSSADLADFDFNQDTGALSFQGGAPIRSAVNALRIRATSNGKEAPQRLISVILNSPAEFTPTSFIIPENSAPVFILTRPSFGGNSYNSHISGFDNALLASSGAGISGGVFRYTLDFFDPPDFENPRDVDIIGGLDIGGNNIYVVRVDRTQTSDGAVTSSYISITVTNLDDNDPVLTTTRSTYNAPENSTATIVRLAASDADGDTLSFEIIEAAARSPDKDRFSLNPSTGDLAFKTPKDFEAPDDAGADGIYHITVQATSGDPKKFSNPLALEIRLIDGNEAPTLSTTRTTYDVFENSMDTIATLEGDDADQDPLSFEIVSGAGSPDKDRFSLNPSTGDLAFVSPQDFESPGDANVDGIYHITVRATSTSTSGSGSGRSPQASSPLALTITLIAIDEDDPTIAPSQEDYFIQAGVTEIATFIIVDSDRGETRTFDALEAAPGGSVTDLSAFNFDTDSGVLSFTGRSSNNVSKLVIRANSDAKAAMHAITVNRDSPPAFVVTAFDLPENSNPPQVMLSVTDANDETVTLTLEDDELDGTLFTLEDIASVGGTTTANLRFIAQPDFENPADAATSGGDAAGNNIYLVRVHASSSDSAGNPTLLAERISITVTDVDEDPTLAVSLGPYNLAENSTDVIATLTGADLDDGDVVRLSTSGTDAALFSLDGATGELTFTNAPDFERPRGAPLAADNTNTYNLSVQAVSGTPPNERESAVLDLVITVTPVDDNEPVLDPTQAIYDAPENSIETIVTLTATDADGDIPSFNILNNPALSPDHDDFILDPSSGDLRFASAQDFEAHQDARGGRLFAIRVEVTSGSINRDRAPRLLLIRLTDVDDNDPVLTTTQATYDVPENTMDTIVRLEASDTEGNPLSFEIASGADSPDEDRFTLGASTGILTFANPQDFEAPNDVGTDGTYNITVQATSTPTPGSGSPPRTSSPLALAIRLTAVDEFAPVLAPKTSPLTTTEGETAPLQTFTLTDADAGEAQFFALSGAGVSSFELDTATGALRLPVTTDAGSYSLTVTGTSGSRADAFTFTVDVMSDNPAVFADTEFALPEDSNPPQVMLSATDADGATVTLTLMNVRDGTLFSLEDSASVGGTTTANLRFVDPPDFENPADTATPAGDNIYLVEVQASSMTGARAARTTTETITIRITGVDEHLPTFAVSPGPYNLAENSTAVIATLTAADLDDDDMVSLSASGADEALFSIDAAGALTFAAAPDFERPRGAPLSGANTNTYNLSVQATSTSGSGTPPNVRESAALDLVITVTPVDEEAPVLAPRDSPLTSVEGETAPLQTFTLTDADAGEVQAFALSGTGASSFTLDTTTGALTLPAATGAGSYDLTVTGISGDRADAFPLTVNIAADAAPAFVETNFSLVEGTNDPITLTATEANNDDVVFALQGGPDDGRFTFADGGAGDNTATLTFNAVPDFEVPLDDGGNNIYEVSVQASSMTGARAARTTTETITITVTGVDEHLPTFAVSPGPYNLAENSTAVIATLTGADQDDGDMVSLSTAGTDAALFSIDGAGALTFTNAPDFERPRGAPLSGANTNTYNLSVQAVSGTPPNERRSAALDLTITVTPVDEEAPVLAPRDSPLTSVEGEMDALQTFTLTDADAGEAQTFALSGTGASSFELGTTSGVLTLPAATGAGSYDLTVTGISGDRADAFPLTVNIAADAAPAFVETSFDLAENTNDPITLTATEANNDDVVFALQSGMDAGHFTFADGGAGDNTATLTFNAVPDFEVPLDDGGNNIYEVSVQVSSTTGARAARTTTETIRITVTGVDDNAPALDPTQAIYEAPENSTETIITLQATDADGDTPNFEIVDNTATSPDRARFDLNELSGVLAFATPQDFEAPNDVGTDGTYNITVQATSTSGSGSPPRTSSPLALTIRLTPVDEHLPVLAPKTSPLTSVEGETAPLQTFTLTDADAGEAQFFALSGAGVSSFELDTATGVLRLPVTTGAGSYSLTVTGTSGSQTDTFTFTVDVMSDNPAVFADTAFELPEDRNPPQVMLSATDADGATVTLTLMNVRDGALFSLEDISSTGGTTTANLRFIAQPDFENPADTATSGSDTGGDNIYLVEVQASSTTGARAARTTTETITIRITGVDDNDPVLTTTRATYNAPENSTETIVTLQATDADGDTPNFEIVDNTATSPDRARFDLNELSGVLTFATPQDFEAPNDVGTDGIYNITVQATSTSGSGTGSRTSNTLALAVTLTAIDEADPTIAPAQATYNFLTGTTGTIATFTIVDSDQGETRTFSTLEAAPGTTNLTDFNFDPSSGVLSFQGAAANGTSALIISATSNARPAMRTITITVMSDNPAVFADTAFELPEDNDPPQVMLSATDADGATVTLTLMNVRDGALFSLEDGASVGGTTTANLRFIAQPDFENPADTATSGSDMAGDNIYLVEVQARSMDLNGVAVPITETIRITVTGVDEHLPTLTITPGPYSLAENSTAVIATLTGADSDDGDVVHLIKTGADEARFNLDPGTGILTFTNVPDFERPRGMPLSGANTNTYNLSVQATSTSGSGTPPNERESAVLDLVITVTPVDEDTPRIVASPDFVTYNFLTGTTGPIITFTLEDTDAGAADAGAGTGGEARQFGALGGADATSGLFSLTPTASETANLTFASAATAGTSALTITATSGGQAATLPITVVVSNDQMPSLQTASFDVAENSTPDLPLSAPDPDGSDIDVTLSLLSGLDSALFEIVNIVPGEASAALRFIDAPDFEMPQDVATTTPPDPANNNIYLVNIQASSLNLAGETVNITQTIRVTVLGVDDNEPVLDPTQAIYDAPENSIETIVTLTATDADGDIPSFNILNNPALSPDHDNFILDPSSGDLRFASAQDFEAHQDTRGGRLFAIRVEVTSGSINRDRAPRLLRIRLTDVDDNDPVLTTTRAAYDVPENTMDTIVRLEATDAEGNPLSFEIASGADSPDEDRFTLGASTGILTFANPQDFEVPNDVGTDGTYNITVQATSTPTPGSGSPPRTSSPLALAIRLTPVDEFTPVLAPKTSPLTTTEGETSPLQTFTLTDADAGEVQSFALSGADVSSFELNPTSGVLRLPVTTGAGSYDLTVTGTSGSRADAFTFTVDVMSDNPAVFADTAFELPEDRNPPQVMLSATDADGATVTLTLMNVRDGALFTLEDISSVGGTTTANLRFIDPPDFENPADIATSGSDTAGDNIYLVEVQASSTTGARAARTTTETITIRITGVDEHLPTLAVSPGPYNIAENDTAVIATLTGADPDDGDTVSLSTAGTDAALFSIDGAGALTFTNAPDFERPRGAPLSGANTNTYNLSVQATSTSGSGTPPNERESAALDLTIRVTPVDEEAPVLAPRDSPLTSVEGETAPLQTFTLTDADAGEAQAFALSGAGASSFELGTTSGVLRLPAATGAGSYDLTVTGTSGDRADAFPLTVNIAADAAPAFVETNFSLVEGTNDPITLVATEANNDDVVFALQGGPDDGRFTFADGGAGDNTATLTFNTVPDFEAPEDTGGNNIYEVSVQASSITGGRAARTTTETITIRITGVDEHLPTLAVSPGPYNLAENSTAVIATLTGADQDDGDMVSLSTAGTDAALFSIDGTGALTFTNAPDFERPRGAPLSGANTNTYNLSVQAVSGTPPNERRSITSILNINITPVDEEAPVLAPRDSPLTSVEGETAPLQTFTLVDADAGEAQFFALSGTDASSFELGTTSGVLRLPMDTDAGSYSLTVTGTSGSRADAFTFTVDVMSDNPAVFADTEFELPEDRNPPQVMLSATDADGATVTLTLEDDELDGALFSLEDGASVGGTTTANLRFNDPPDFENPADTATSGGDAAGDNIYLVEVQASSMDLNGVAVPITETIRITVTGVDDNAPVLDPTQAIYEAPENSTEPIVTLQATDADGDIPSFEIVDNAAISPDRNHFILDRSSGVLRFASPQDFEAHQDVERGRLFGIRVKAISGPADIDSAPRLLLIRLTPVDEFAPVLAPKTSPLTTTEGEAAPLQTFTLTDADAGEAQSFALSGADASSFDLNTTTGVLRLPMDTDAGSYSLTVTGTSGSQTDTFTFTVDVMSDNPAVFADTAFELPEDRNPPQVMLSATDADGATVTLELTNARDSTLFTLEDISSTGGTTMANLRFRAQPDFENPADTATSGGDAAGNNIYLVRVRASSMDLNGVAVPITETIRITVTGVDEHLPTLAVTPGPYNLAENSTDVIATLTAADQDDGDAVRLSTAGTDAALFSIDVAGALTFTAAPDFERPRGMPLSGTNTNTYNLSVQAVSGTPPNERESAVLDLVIIVTPVDEDTPVLAPRDSPLTSVEGETAPLQTFTLTDADAGEAQSFALSGANANLFALDTTTGVLTLPTTTDAGNYNLIVTGTSGSRADSFAFTVDVMSDNPAVFADTAFELPEDRNPPQVMLSATDADGATVTLTLTNARDNTLFTLEDISSTGGTTTANLRFIAQPDFENPADTATSGGDAAGNNIYLVRVRASSMDLNGVAVPITEIIRITVTGVDEHLPTLAVSPGPYNLAENSTDVIATLTAADQDDGDVVRLSTAGTDAALFSIDAAGALTFTAAPDFERPRGMLLSGTNTNTYNLSVQAVSGTPPNERRSITSILNINITPVDEDAPVLAPRDSPLTSVEGETAPLQTFTLTDADAGEAQSFALSGAGASSFELGTTSGVLRLPATTGAGSYDLTVTGTSGSQTDTFTFTVDVTGDNPAVFADTAFELPEDRNPPQVVLSATDDDGVTVTLALGNGQDSALFTLEDSLSTGGTTMASLRFRAQPDFENPADTATPAADNIYLVEAQASSTDLNGTVVRTNETITIRITGVDEHLPTLAVTPGPYNLAENSTALIATLTAADQDDGDVVRLSTAGTDAALFSIDAAGTLTFAAAPDFERPRGAPLSGTNTNTYNLSVQAISGIDPNERRSITSILTIRVTPVDEDAPVLAPKTSPLMRVEGEMDALQTFTLTDADAGEAQTFALSGTGASSFALDTTTGALRLAATTGAGSYDLIVTGTSGSRADAFPFTVNIATDAAPAFVGTSFSVVEGTNDPITLTATEANNDDVVFTLQSGLDAGRFTFADGGAGANTATLTFQDAPDFENPLDEDGDHIYEVSVQASSMGGARAARTITETIRITVTGVDDNDPTLTTTQATYEVPENSTEPIVTLQGTDVEGDTLRFEIVDNTGISPDRARFTLDASTGVLAFASPKDFEAPSDANTDRTYQITVRATSTSDSGSGTPPRTSTPLALAIRLTAIDEADPSIAPAQATYSFRTGTTGTIAAFTIEDDDAGETHVFEALEAAPGSTTDLADFRFDTNSGALSFARPAATAVSALIIRATSNGKPAMRTITLTVDDMDAPPEFVETTFSQAENAMPTFTLAATEADGDDVSFTLQSGRDAAYFTLTDGGVSADTAALVFRDAPNFENPQSATLPGDAGVKNTYQMNVQAASTTSPNAEQTITQIITINVTDVDDPPTFTTAADALMIMEGETALTTMIEVIDQDGDPVTLALTGGTDQAQLRLTGGALSFTSAPDFEAPTDTDTNNIYEVEITAISTGSGTGAIVLSAVRTFNITVTDADDNAPELTSPTTFQIQSGETAVAILEATDADAGDTETIVFALTGGADQSQFTLTRAGVLSFTSPADFAEPTDADGDNIYAIEITLTSGSRPHTTQAALEIEVISIDRQSRQRIGNVILAHIARSLADNTQEIIFARTSGRLTNNLALSNRQGDLDDLVDGIQGFSFMRKFDAKQTQARGFSLWGKGHIRTFSASPSETAINNFSGHIYNLNLGADYQTGALLFGGLVTASQSSVKFTSGSTEGQGRIRTKLTTFAPYVHLRFQSGTEIWGSAGFGQGRMRYQSETTGGFERTDLKYAQFAGGLYQPLKALKKTNLALRLDGYTARLKAEAREDVFLAMAGDVSRVRGLLEVGYRRQGAEKGVLDAKLNGGARLETGDIGKGVGLEFGAEITYANPASGLSVSADINAILLHTAQKYRHLDAGLRFLLGPGIKKRGLQFRLEPRIGGTTSAAPLWDGTLVDGGDSPAGQLGTSGLGQLQTALGLSYGFAARQSLLTPFTEMRLDDRGAPIDLMLGMRFSRANLPINITLYTQKTLGTIPGTAPGVHLKLNWR